VLSLTVRVKQGLRVPWSEKDIKSMEMMYSAMMSTTGPSADTVTMLRNGILNPAINSLLSRVRHTNTLVIADRGFPNWPTVETIDISLVDDVPCVLDVFKAIQANFVIGKIVMAEEFRTANDSRIVRHFEESFGAIPVIFEPHVPFKQRVPSAIGLIRTGDTVQYANMILESA
jgi:D-ribose pyranase